MKLPPLNPLSPPRWNPPFSVTGKLTRRLNLPFINGLPSSWAWYRSAVDFFIWDFISGLPFPRMPTWWRRYRQALRVLLGLAVPRMELRVHRKATRLMTILPLPKHLSRDIQRKWALPPLRDRLCPLVLSENARETNLDHSLSSHWWTGRGIILHCIEKKKLSRGAYTQNVLKLKSIIKTIHENSKHTDSIVIDN